MASFPSTFNASGLSSLDQIESCFRGSEILVKVRSKNQAYNNVEFKVTAGQDVAYAKVQIARTLEIGYSQIVWDFIKYYSLAPRC